MFQGMTMNSSPVGVLYLRSVADALTSLGVSVVGAGQPDLRSSAVAIGKHLNSAGLVPILAHGSQEQGKQGWLSKAAANGATVVLMTGGGDIEVPGSAVVELPATLASALSAAGVTVPTGAGAMIVEKDGSVTDRRTPVRQPNPSAADPFASDSTTSRTHFDDIEVVSQPVYQQPVFEAPVPPAAASQPWRYETSAAPAFEAPVAPAYEAPAYAPPAQSGPAPAWGAPGSPSPVSAMPYEVPVAPSPQGRPSSIANAAGFDHDELSVYGDPQGANRARMHGEKGAVILTYAAKGGVYKAERLSNRVPVPVSQRYPDGWATIGELAVGEKVYAADGSITDVTGLSEIMQAQTYEVVFSDGQKVVVAEDHLWKVSSSYSREQQAPCFQKLRDARVERFAARAETIRELARQVGHGSFASVRGISLLAECSYATAQKAALSLARSSAVELPDPKSDEGSVSKSVSGYPVDETLMVVADMVEQFGRVSGAGKLPTSLESVHTTKEMFEQKHVLSHDKPSTNWAVRLARPIDGPEVDLAVPPYVLGAWLGDGTTTNATITSGFTSECIDPLTGATDQEYILRELSAYGTRVAACDPQKLQPYGLQQHLRATGVLGNKHIPAIYLRASYEQRLALLQGLMDTDGSIADDGGCVLRFNHKRLAHDSMELIRSLGIKVAMTTFPSSLVEPDPGRPGFKRSRLTGTTSILSFTTTTQVFRLPRKARRIKAATRRTQDWIYVTDIHKLDVEPVRCIAVAHPEHLYLTADFIPTHNTSTSLQLAQRAAKQGGLRVVLIDMNRGQGGTRLLMKLLRANVPTIFDLATRPGMQPSQVVIPAEILNEGRPERFDKIAFSTTFAPPDTVDDDSFRQVTAETYSRVIDYARSIADLVIVDTQTLDSVDMTGLIDNVMTPALAGGAWGLGLTNTGAEGATFLYNRLAKFYRRGAEQTRMLLAITQVNDSVSSFSDALLERYATIATPVGVIPRDEYIEASLSQGKFCEDSPVVLPVIDSVLYRVTGDRRFAEQPPAAPAKQKKWRLLSRRSR